VASLEGDSVNCGERNLNLAPLLFIFIDVVQVVVYKVSVRQELVRDTQLQWKPRLVDVLEQLLLKFVRITARPVSSSPRVCRRRTSACPRPM
jgi:hypothetical protein